MQYINTNKMESSESDVEIENKNDHIKKKEKVKKQIKEEEKEKIQEKEKEKVQEKEKEKEQKEEREKEKKEKIKKKGKKKDNHKEEENQDEINAERDVNEEKIYKLINTVFKDKSKKKEILEKLRPFFSLKVVPQREIERVYSAVEVIPAEKINLVTMNIKNEEKHEGNNWFAENSKSVGLSDFDLDLSLNILVHKQSLKFDNKDDNSGSTTENKSKRYCIHSEIVKLFRVIIDFKDIKLAKQVTEELEEVRNSNATEKKILIEKLVDKFGLYIPLELIVGGRVNYSFVGNSSQEIKEIHSLLQKQVKAKAGGGIKVFSGSAGINYDKENINNNS